MALALLSLSTGCGASRGKSLAAEPGPSGPGKDQGAAAGPITELPPAKDVFTGQLIASLFSYPHALEASDATLGPEWKDKGKIVWARSYVAGDDSFAPVTLVLFESPYKGMTLTPAEKNVLRLSNGYKELAYEGSGRRGFAWRAAGGADDAIETALIPSPAGRFEMLVLIDVPKGGPKERKGTEAYRSLLMDFTVTLIETVARGIDAQWAGDGF